MNRPSRHRLSVTHGPAPSPAPQRPPLEAADAALQSGRPDAAERALRQADVIGRRDAVGMHLLAIACAQQQRFADAESVWRELLTLPGQESRVLPNLGRMLEKAGRLDEARELLSRAVELAPQDYTARLNLGACLHALGRYAEAREHTQEVARLRPDLAQPWFNLGSLWQAEDRFAQASRCYEQALSIDPTHQGAISNGLFLQHFLPEVTPADRLRCATERGDALCRHMAPKQHHRSRTPGPLRVGLLSADFRAHSVGWFLAGFLPLLDPALLRVTAFNNGTQSDALTARLRAACDGWHDIHALGDDAAAELIASHGMDLLVDLSGMTAGHRLGVLARQPAPVQVNWLGYFGTSGLPTMHWVLADPLCLPPGEEGLYRERVWRLPHSRFCMAPPDDAPFVSALPALTKGHVTLGSFQELAKLNDRVLSLWSRVLAALPQAQLRIQSKRLSKPAEVALMRERLLAAGITPDRCDLLPATTRADYLRAHHDVDFILDSFPYTGGTTTTEALWMGVPTLTLTSPGMLGRQGEAHLRNLGLDDWVANSETEFVELAVRHASPTGLQALATLRSGLRERCRVSPLFDNVRFAADWTQALQAMHQSFLSNPPQEP
ncbi:tetratricopeptide repeat protein [Hydrogenophaga sp. RWCD_12]|uniref:O-linked N-acetylglucosamine transferase, SPINDLY family protein n=1 Tax=Hydrogenophaga sp. RWCD_12 TaxID=3391190 RepID=UPI0039854D1C